MLDANIFLWYPTKNEAIVARCPSHRFPDIDPSKIYIDTISIPDLVTTPLFPEANICGSENTFSISPNGTTAVMYTFEGYEGGIPKGTFWISNLANRNSEPMVFPFPEDIFDIDGWVDNDSFFYTGYSGGGHIYANVINITTGAKAQGGTVHGEFLETNLGFVAGYDGMDYDQRVTAVVLTSSENDYGHLLESGPFVNILSRKITETSFEHLFNSRYEDWLTNAPQMLVTSWSSDVSLWDIDLLHQSDVVDLQLWNVETNDLNMLISGAVYGRFSPNGHFLLYLTPASEHPIAHLYDWQNQQMILEQPVAANREPGRAIQFEMSFSPDGRFLTYFTPKENGTTTLQIIDTQTGQIQWQFTNPETPIIWSPTSEHLIFRDASSNLALFSLVDGRSHPLTLSGGQLLTKPKWSHDGRFLSVFIQTEMGGETAIIELTEN